jgi:hypothetical protein
VIDIAARIQAVVDELGPPTPEQIARLRLILAHCEPEAADAA